MKTLFVIRMHSLIDVITNSSSELFVISGKKTEDAVRKVIDKLIEANNATDEESTTYEAAFGNDDAVRRIKTKEEAIEAVIRYSFYLINETYKMRMMGMNDEYKHYEDKDLKKLLESGEIDYKKYINIGDILVTSADDNSIPWGIQQAIETMFNCKRFHLG